MTKARGRQQHERGIIHVDDASQRAVWEPEWAECARQDFIVDLLGGEDRLVVRYTVHRGQVVDFAMTQQALMDDEWIYGSSPANIFATISEGRPNGMPSYGGHIPDDQIWKLTTYVRSLGGFEPKGTTAPRAEEMQARRSEEPK